MTAAFQNALRSVECSICTEVLSDPRILPCGHSLCGPKSTEKCIVKLEQKGIIACPVCRTNHQMKAQDVPPAYGYGDMLAVIESVKMQKMCDKHSEELLFYCRKEKKQICITCWQTDHIGFDHRVEPISVLKQQKLSQYCKNIVLKRHLQFTCDRSETLSEVVEKLEKVVTCLKGELAQETKRCEAIRLVLSKEKELTEKLSSENFSTSNALVVTFDELCTDLEEASVTDRIAETEIELQIIASKIKSLKQNERPLFGLKKPQTEIENESNSDTEAEVLGRKAQKELTLSSFCRDLIKDASSDGDAISKLMEPLEPRRVRRSQTFTARPATVSLNSILNSEAFSTLPKARSTEIGASSTPDESKPVLNLWTNSTILGQVEHQPDSSLCYPVFCPDNRWIFVLSKNNCLTRYSVNTAWQSCFILEKQQKLENKVSSMAMGPHETIYISFDAGIIPSIHQFHCGKKFLRIAGEIRMNRPTNLFLNVKYLLSTVPKISVVFVLPASLHSPLNTSYVFQENFLIRSLDLPGNNMHSLFHDFGAKTGLLIDFDQSVFYKFEWASVLGSKSETVFRYFTDFPEVECKCVTSFSVSEVTREIIALGIWNSLKMTSSGDRRVILKTFQSKKTKCATAELVGRSEVRVPLGFQPLYFVSIRDGLVIGRSTENDDVILLSKLS